MINSNTPVRHHPFPEDDEELDHNDRWRGEDEDDFDELLEDGLDIDLDEDDDEWNCWQ